MATPKTSQLANLASQFPAMAQQGARAQQSQARLAAAQQVQQQAQGPQPPRPISAAMMGAELYTAQAAASREAAQRAQRGAATVAQMELQRQRQEQQKLLFERARGIQNTLRQQEQQLQQLNAEVKRNLYDRAMKFEKDELNRTVWKTSQLMDYAVRKTQRAQDYRKLEQSVGMMQRRRTQLLQISKAQIKQALTQEFEKNEAAQNRDLLERLKKAEVAVEKKIAENKAKATEHSNMWSAGGEMIGTAIGAIAGGIIAAKTGGVGAVAISKGAAAGGLIGKSLGGGLGGLLGKETAPTPGKLSREEIRAKIRGGR